MIDVSDVLGWVVPDPEKCRADAVALMDANPGETPEQLAERVIAGARKFAAASGGATGAFGNIVIALPAALADMSAVLKIEGTMAGTVAALLDPISLNSPETFKADMLSIVFPGAISQALRQVGVRAGQRLTRDLLRKYLTRSVAESATKYAAKYLALHLTEKALVSKTIPLVGAGIGAGWNWLEVQAVGKRAIDYYQRKHFTPHRGPNRYQRVKSMIKALPLRRKRASEGKTDEATQ